MKKNNTFFTKLTQFEYWPSYAFYVPLLPYYFFKALQRGHLFYFSATNPSIQFAGNGTESKYKTIMLVPEKHRPKTVFIPANESIELVTKKLTKAQINFPIIAKPDVGFRGFLVKKIDTPQALKNYIEKFDVDIILQEFIDYKNECGIFYSRIPDEEKGKITSITLKKFLTITGDGTSTISQLIRNDKRASVYYDYLKTINKNSMSNILDKGEEKIISVIGNHARGTQFINGNHLIDSEIESTLDQLNKQINGWFYGRLDIKYNNFEEIKKGENFKILEINGIIAEPTHMYDPTSGTTFFDAIKIIKKHWKIIDKIAVVNHKKFNVPYPKTSDYFKNLAWLRSYSKKINRLNKI